MSYHIVTAEQRSDAWVKARLGRLTSSCAADFLATIKSGEAAARRNLRVRLVLERLTGEPQENGFQSFDMQRGIELEDDARAAYEARTGAFVTPCGFLAHDDLMAGASPDGQMDDFAALVELKVPKAATHFGYLRSGQVPDDYLKQIRHQLWLTGAAWCDFVSYAPQFPEPLRLMVSRVTMGNAERDSYELMVRAFLNEVDQELDTCKALAVPA